MNNLSVRRSFSLIALPCLLGGLFCIAEIAPLFVGIESGTATFRSGTNVPGIEVKGTSNALTAHAEVTKEGKDLTVHGIDATLPVKSLATGMKTRDDHMRKYIFETAGGQAPDIRYVAGMVTCPPVGGSLEYSCQVGGELSIRGISRPMAIRLKVKEQGGAASAFRVAGDGTVKLSDYGIVPPSEFGVKPADDVEIHLNFTGKPQQRTTRDSAGGQ